MKLLTYRVVCQLVIVSMVKTLLHTCYQYRINHDHLSKNRPTKLAKYAKSRGINSTDRLTPIVLDSVGVFADRVRELNDILSDVRNYMWDKRGGREVAWLNSSVLSSKQPNVIWTGYDDAMERLSSQYGHLVMSVTLRWLNTEQHVSSNEQWNSTTDRTNLLLQNYFQWTADHQLCTWIETPGAIKARYDLVYNRTCERNMVEGASTPRSIKPLMFNTISVPPEPVPENFYTRLPSHVFTLHVVRDAIVTSFGEVISGNLKLVRLYCVLR